MPRGCDAPACRCRGSPGSGRGGRPASARRERPACPPRRECVPSCRTNATMSTPGGSAISPCDEPHEQVVDLVGLGLRLGLGDAAEGEDALLAAGRRRRSRVAAVPFLMRGHVARLSRQCHPNATGRPYQFLTRAVGNLSGIAISLVPAVGIEPTRGFPPEDFKSSASAFPPRRRDLQPDAFAQSKKHYTR